MDTEKSPTIPSMGFPRHSATNLNNSELGPNFIGKTRDTPENQPASYDGPSVPGLE